MECDKNRAKGKMFFAVQFYYIGLMSSDTGKYQIPDGEESGEILPNKLGITDKQELGEAEAEGFANTELELIEELTDETVFDVAYIRGIHRRSLSYLYEFAGEYRGVNMSKGGFHFAGALAIPRAMQNFEQEVLHELPHQYDSREQLIHDIGLVHAELLFIHPFRDGNGRTMRILANLMSYKQGYDEIDVDPISKGGEMRKRYIKGVQAAGEENYKPMIQLIGELFPSN